MLPSISGLSEKIHKLCYTQTEAAQHLGVSEVTVWRWIRDGKLTAYRIGREVLIEKAELEKMRR